MKESPFAELVRERMSEQGLGLRELCRRAEVDPSFLSKVLAGKRSPPAEEALLRRLAAVLQVDAPRLIVCAGRIPSEWRRLWSDRDLFHSVHHLAVSSEKALTRSTLPAAKVPARSPAVVPAPVREAPKKPKEEDPREFGEELL